MIRSIALWLLALAVVVITTEDFRVFYNREGPKPHIYSDGKTLAEVVYDANGALAHCRLYELENDEDAEVIILASGLPAKYPSFQEMLQLINNCTQLAVPSYNTTDIEPLMDGVGSWSPWILWNGIVPGTKWCGVGDVAESFEQLGTEYDVDACCRAHDHCPVKLKAFRTGYGLINLSLYTRSHCDCDKEFYGCLKNSKNRLSDTVGNFYFNIMQARCLQDYVSYVCVENRTEIDGTQICLRWSADPTKKFMQVSVTGLKY